MYWQNGCPASALPSTSSRASFREAKGMALRADGVSSPQRMARSAAQALPRRIPSLRRDAAFSPLISNAAYSQTYRSPMYVRARKHKASGSPASAASRRSRTPSAVFSGSNCIHISRMPSSVLSENTFSMILSPQGPFSRDFPSVGFPSVGFPAPFFHFFGDVFPFFHIGKP